jgi:hypothetical protein
MKRQNKLNTQSQEQQLAAQSLQQQSAAREFGSVEEMLRHDALHTPVPPKVAERLQASIRQTTPPASSWWRRLFGGSKGQSS